MNQKKYAFISAFILLGVVISCSVDESKFPLPYNARTTGAYLRMYRVTSNVFDVNNIAASAFETVYEPVDVKNGDDTDSIRFYVSFRRGAALSREMKVKAVSVSAFTKPASPTYSVYKRGAVRVTMQEALNVLAPIAGIDPDGAGPIVGASPASGLSAYPVGPTLADDQFIFRMIQVLKDGRKFTVLNPQFPVNPAFGNPAEENGTPNITTGQFYSSPFTYTITARTQFSGTAWTGTYSLQQRTNWAPSHSIQLHEVSYPAYMNAVNFPTQTVTLAVPANGLPTQRSFTVNYRGGSTTMNLNLEPSSPGLAAGTVANLVSNFGMTGATTANLGTVFVLLDNSGQNCSSKRQFYWTTPTGGTFGGSVAAAARFTAPPGLPGFAIPNRGVYMTTIDGLTVGNVMTIGLDDDADEYGRRNGYCTWTRRIQLTLTKL